MWLPKNLGIDDLLIEKSGGEIDRQLLNQLYKYDFKLAEMQDDHVLGIGDNRDLLNRVDTALQNITKEDLRKLFLKQETTKKGKVYRSLRKRTLTDEEAVDAIDVNRHKEHLSESIKSLNIEINQKERAILENPDNLNKYLDEIEDKKSKRAELIAEHSLSDQELKVLLQEQLRNNPTLWDDRRAINNADGKTKTRNKNHSSSNTRLALNTGMGLGSMIAIFAVGGASATAGLAIVGGAIGASLGGIAGMVALAAPIAYFITHSWIPRSKARRQAKLVKELIKERTKRESRQQELDHEIGALRNDHRNHLAIQQMKEHGVPPPPPPFELEEGIGTGQNQNNIKERLLSPEHIKQFMAVNSGKTTTHKKQKKPKVYSPKRGHKPIRLG